MHGTADQTQLAAPPAVKRRLLRVLGTSITLLPPVREQARADLGFDIEFTQLDFLDCQRQAAMEPQGYDVYEQCFHNLDIVWFWGALQPIDIARIPEWDNISDLVKLGGVSKYAGRGRGDAPVKKLYIQPGGFLGSKPSRHISMLPTRGCSGPLPRCGQAGPGCWTAVPRAGLRWSTNPPSAFSMRPLPPKPVASWSLPISAT